MPSKAYNMERRRKDDAAYEAQNIERARLGHEYEQKFGTLRDRLEELGINPYLLANPNAVHFAIRMAALKSMRVVGCGVRGRNG